MTDSIWGYHPAAGHTAGTDLVGYKVEAVDGAIGKVDKHTDDADSAHLIVDIGVWIFGRHVMLPAGTVKRIDRDARKIYVALTQEQIRESPEFDRARHVGDADYHDRIGGYYQNHRA
ncbi:PRC-barrel domain containing protein [Streptomyces triticiradicis]|uniref:PRC-barrel domain containing protein n=1 Tax=Streptomyces triticiradicis TaxID=2651189 RepID=A0A7J5DPY9_9ACTN|nr:PRC-barrel domain containing protein [Streptomyces triticiradicis]KAB1990833.1 PRC-barrel domain containing protein [Streptomyces triticiradicis]